MAEKMDGGCACGRVRFTANIENDEAYLCHCRMCQKATGGFAAALVQVEHGKLASAARKVGAELVYTSAPKATLSWADTGYWTKSFEVAGTVRTAKAYISPQTPIRSYFTVIVTFSDSTGGFCGWCFQSPSSSCSVCLPGLSVNVVSVWPPPKCWIWSLLPSGLV